MVNYGLLFNIPGLRIVIFWALITLRIFRIVWIMMSKGLDVLYLHQKFVAFCDGLTGIIYDHCSVSYSSLILPPVFSPKKGSSDTAHEINLFRSCHLSIDTKAQVSPVLP